MGGVRGDVVEAEEEAGEEGGSTSGETITITESVDPTISIRRRENSAVLCHTSSARIYIFKWPIRNMGGAPSITFDLLVWHGSGYDVCPQDSRVWCI